MNLLNALAFAYTKRKEKGEQFVHVNFKSVFKNEALLVKIFSIIQVKIYNFLLVSSNNTQYFSVRDVWNEMGPCRAVTR